MISKLWYKLSICVRLVQTSVCERLVQTSVCERAQLVTVKHFA